MLEEFLRYPSPTPAEEQDSPRVRVDKGGDVGQLFQGGRVRIGKGGKRQTVGVHGQLTSIPDHGDVLVR